MKTLQATNTQTVQKPARIQVFDVTYGNRLVGHLVVDGVERVTNFLAVNR
jgi:hypothetical protein